jgi:hypothetical protein
MDEISQHHSPSLQQLDGLSLEASLGAFLSGMRAHCGDIDNFLICIAVAARNYGVSDRDVGVRVPQAPQGLKVRASNILSVSAATGIPRETVRRKTLKLCEMGLLERAGRKLFVTAKFFAMAEPERMRAHAKLKGQARPFGSDAIKSA